MRYTAPYLPDGYAFAALAWQKGDGPPQFAVRTAPGIEAGPHGFWRAASISKIVVGQVARAVLEPVAPGTDVSDLLGWRLRSPYHPLTPITVAQLASHTSGLSDAAGYLVPDGSSPQDWVRARGAACFGPQAPGQRFDYSNLGYLLLAALAETVTGTRLDRLAERYVLGPLGIDAGFNWIGLGAGPRRDRLPTYRRDGKAFVAQIDQEIDEYAGNTAAYRPGRDTARLSPQGGLRLSLDGALTLARGLAGMDAAPLITPAEVEVDPMGGLMEGYGWGLQVFERPNFYPRPLVGHFANAYGFAGGVWYDRAADLAFVIALNGLDLGDEADRIRPEERALFAEAAALAEQGA